MNTANTTSWTSEEALDAVRPQVREMLTSVPAFAALEPEEQRQLASDMVKVVAYMTDPDGLSHEQAGVSPGAPAQALAKEDPVTATKRQLSSSPGFAGKDFAAGAVREGVEQFGALVQKVDFPKFVGGLIENVFQAIVESSIAQMRAYGELVGNVAKTVDQFMVDNISPGAGRDWLAARYSDTLGVELGSTTEGFEESEGADGEAPKTSRVTASGEDAPVKLAAISRDLNLVPPVTDITDSDAEQRLVTAARLHMAKSRQQLLASMVMLGINRIVVTDGSIQAKVIFDMRASDTAKRHYKASMYDRQSQRYKESMSVSYGSWFSPIDASTSFEGEQAHVATVGSAVDETSESKAEVKARLSGDVRVNFKSDYLPLEKMATPEMISVIQGNSSPYNPNRPTGEGG